jgi:hypothetical protein
MRVLCSEIDEFSLAGNRENRMIEPKSLQICKLYYAIWERIKKKTNKKKVLMKTATPPMISNVNACVLRFSEFFAELKFIAPSIMPTSGTNKVKTIKRTNVPPFQGS